MSLSAKAQLLCNVAPKLSWVLGLSFTLRNKKWLRCSVDCHRGPLCEDSPQLPYVCSDSSSELLLGETGACYPQVTSTSFLTDREASCLCEPSFTWSGICYQFSVLGFERWFLTPSCAFIAMSLGGLCADCKKDQGDLLVHELKVILDIILFDPFALMQTCGLRGTAVEWYVNPLCSLISNPFIAIRSLLEVLFGNPSSPIIGKSEIYCFSAYIGGDG